MTKNESHLQDQNQTNVICPMTNISQTKIIYCVLLLTNLQPSLWPLQFVYVTEPKANKNTTIAYIQDN